MPTLMQLSEGPLRGAHVRLPARAPLRIATTHGLSEALSGYQGPNPYGDFVRTFTDAGGIRIAFKIRDPQLWRTIVRALLWLAVMAATFWFILRASPYPLIPRSCGVARACPGSVVLAHGLLNSIAIGAMAAVCWWILFFADQTLTSIEIRRNCMIIDDADVFWSDRMDLGWPQIVPGDEAESFVLRGVYGTREIDYVTLHAFDEKDRAIQVLGAHLQFAMQQLWAQPGASRGGV